MALDFSNKQGGKVFGQVKARQEQQLDDINQEYLEDEDLKEVEELEEKLLSFKKQFMEYDLDTDGEIDFDELKLMMEKLGQAKTHLELKKMIAEVDKTGKGTICYKDFVDMMLGTRTTVLKLILLFEEKMRKMNDKTSPKGPPPKKSLSDLP